MIVSVKREPSGFNGSGTAEVYPFVSVREMRGFFIGPHLPTDKRMRKIGGLMYAGYARK
jgi:hypothetical protein